MKTITELLKALRNEPQPLYRQLELPLAPRPLTRDEKQVVRRLKRLRERLATI